MKKYNYAAGIVTCLFAGCLLTHVSAQSIIAKGGTVTAEKPGNPSNELVEKLVDDNASTKYLTFNVAPLWIQWQCNNPEILKIYTLVSANDAPDRDPKNWTVAGSNDGNNWTVLDTRTDVSFSSRYMNKTFFVNNNTAYTYYRLNISLMNGGGLFQLAEWGLFEGGAPAAPTNLNGISSGSNEVLLTWTDNTPIEENYEIERSDDGLTYTKIATVDPQVVEYLDEDAGVNKVYYYRVRAVNPNGQSTYATKTTTTLDLNGTFEDLTDDGGTLSVSNENTSNANESSSKLIDNDLNTKYLLPGAFTGYNFSYHSTKGEDLYVTKYTLISGNDDPGRDPKSWKFEGSSNGSSWTTVDTRTEELFPNRSQARTFRLASPAQYSYYRISVTANNGNTSIMGQITEWQIWAINPDIPLAPDALTAEAISKVEIKLKWNDNASDETGYQVERLSSEGVFVSVKELPANTITYTDNGLTPAKRYYYRVRGVGENGLTVHSNMATDSTWYDPNLPLPPINLQATTLSNTAVNLTWQDNSTNETGFKIQRSKDGVVYSNVAAALDADVESYEDSTLTLATHYYYRILAFNAAGDALLYSNTAEATTTGSNEPPTMNQLSDYITCNYLDIQNIPVTNITPGPESYQKTSLSVSSDNNDLFEQLTISQPAEGAATFSYKLATNSVGTANVTVTLKDDGGSLNDGNDTYALMFKIEAYKLDIFASSDEGNVINKGDIIHLRSSSSLAQHFEWDDAPGILEGQSTDVLTVRPTRGYNYIVTASTGDGCKESTSIMIHIKGDFGLDAANVLTPNNDGKNDVWTIWNLHTYPGNVVKVYDMSGHEVFSKKDYANDWNGTYQGQALADGVYYYIIELGGGIGTVRGSLSIIND